jgi:hypothetical protein
VKKGKEDGVRKLMGVVPDKIIIKEKVKKVEAMETGKKPLPTNSNIPCSRRGTSYGISSSFYYAATR